MRLPPPEILRSQSLPNDAVVVVRGGGRSLDDTTLERTVADCWSAYGFFGLSVFADPDTTGLTTVTRQTPLVRRRLIRTARVGRLRQAGFEVMPTFKNPYHFSIVIPDANLATFAVVRRCFEPPIANPGYGLE